MCTHMCVCVRALACFLFASVDMNACYQICSSSLTYLCDFMSRMHPTTLLPHQAMPKVLDCDWQCVFVCIVDLCHWT